MKIIIYVFTFLLFTLNAYSIGKSPNHTERNWRYIETEHFIIHYYKDFEYLAKMSADIAEESYFRITSDLDAYPSNKIPVILTQDQFLNGYAEPIKNRIVLDPYLMRSSVIGIKRFILHEFAHIITYEAISTGNVISKITNFGNVPTWVMEGIAQYEAEYWYPSYDRMLRLNTLERNILTPTERDAFTILGADEGASGYNEGYSIIKFIMDKYGHDKLSKILFEIKTSNVPFFIALERIIGKSLLVLEGEWRQFLEEKYDNQISTINSDVGKIFIKREKTEANIKPQMSPDGKIFTFMSSKGKNSYINIRGKIIGLLPIRAFLTDKGYNYSKKITSERIDKGGVFTEKDSKSKVVVGGVIDYSWSHNSKMIVYTELTPDDLGQPDTKISFLKVNIDKYNNINFKKLYDYNFKVYDENFNKPLKYLSSPDFLPYEDKVIFSADNGEINNIYSISLSDLEKKNKKIKAKNLTNTKSFIYRDIKVSPNGKYIVASFYKAGNGTNLMLIDYYNLSKKQITFNDDKHSSFSPSWHENSKFIYYSSDIDEISNIYKYDIENNKNFKLTNSYSCLEFPFYKENKLYFTSYYSKGTDIRVEEINNLKEEEFYFENQKEEEDFLIVNNYVEKEYFPTLLPDLILPITGMDERGDQLGIRLSFDDILQKHGINITLAYGLLSSRFSYGISYINRMLPPTIGIQISEFPSIAATMDGKNYYFQRVQGGTLFIAHPLFNDFSQEISNIGILELSINNLNPVREFISSNANRNLIREGLNNYIAFEFQSQNIYGGYTSDIHPLGGYRFNLRVEDASRFLGSKYEYIQIKSDLRNYISIPFILDNVLALRGNLEFSTGNITPLFLGGPPINVNMGIQNFVPLRGFGIAELLGNRLVLGSLEYRFPIFTRMNITLSSLYIDGIYGTLFVDAGDSWFEEERKFQLNTGLGGELRIRIGVGNRNTIGTYIGLARKVIQENKLLDNDKVSNQFYFGFANTF
jgi:hypothetical protein